MLRLCLQEFGGDLWDLLLGLYQNMADLAIQSQMFAKYGFLFHLVRISLIVILLAAISSDVIHPLLNETFCVMHYLHL